MLPSPELEARPRPLLRAHTVVILDDDATALAALRRTLRAEPYELLTSQDPSQVLRWVDRRDVSLLVSDLRMPAMEGTELLEEVRRQSPWTAGVILTGYPEDLRLSPELKRWVLQVLLKPWEEQGLREMLRQILRGREETRPPQDRSDFEGDFDPEG